jgi:hypothetical protein
MPCLAKRESRGFSRDRQTGQEPMQIAALWLKRRYTLFTSISFNSKRK